MAYYSKVEEYSIHDNGFYGEVEITYGPEKKDETPPPPPSAASAWDSYQHERERAHSIGSNEHTR